MISNVEQYQNIKKFIIKIVQNKTCNERLNGCNTHFIIHLVKLLKCLKIFVLNFHVAQTPITVAL